MGTKFQKSGFTVNLRFDVVDACCCKPDHSFFICLNNRFEETDPNVTLKFTETPSLLNYQEKYVRSARRSPQFNSFKS